MGERQRAFVTLKVEDFCFDIPIEVIEKSKPFNLDCVVDISEIKGEVGGFKTHDFYNGDVMLNIEKEMQCHG